jgi:hypothetical protein
MCRECALPYLLQWHPIDFVAIYTYKILLTTGDEVGTETNVAAVVASPICSS